MKKKDIRILLVDDDADILEIVGYNLSQEGYQISTAANGRDAIAKAKKVLPHLIIMDVMMPEMDGMEACENIRKIPELSNVIINPRQIDSIHVHSFWELGKCVTL